MSRRFLTFFLFLFILVNKVYAVDCRFFWNMDLFPNQPGTFPCDQFADVNNSKIYHYQENWPNDPEELTLMNQIKEAVKDSIDKYSAFGVMPGMRIIYTGQDSDVNNTIVATVFGLQMDISHDCPVIVYKRIFKSSVNGKLMSEAERKQTIAHELFHCFQAKNLRPQMYGPSGSDDSLRQKLSGWWIEGTAQYFSNVVYPTANEEFEPAPTYDSDKNFTTQNDNYSVGVFFQSYANHANGPIGVINLLKALPNNGGIKEEYQALSLLPLVADNLHYFAKEISTDQIADTGGGYLPTTFQPSSDFVLVPEVDQDFSAPVTPYVSKITKFLFAPEGNYKIYPIVSDPSLGIRVSFREKKYGSNWSTMTPNSYMEVNTSCDKQEKVYEFLITSTSPENKNVEAKFKLEYNKSPCLCSDHVKFDTCLIGNWVVDNSSLDELLIKVLGPNNQYKGSDHSIYLTITKDQKFYVDFAAFGIEYNIIQNMNGSSSAIPVRNTFYGTGESLIGSLDKENLCLKEGVGSLEILTEMYLGPTEISGTGYYYFQDGTINYQCQNNILTITGKSGTFDYNVRLKRN